MNYDRQIKTIGSENQTKLKKSKALIVGCGGLGSQVADKLARSGINLKIVDADVVEETNLHRTIYRKNDTGKMKVKALKGLIQETTDIKTETLENRISEKNIMDLVEGVDVAIDCLDNIESRRLLNKACLEKKMPLVHGAVGGERGESITFTFKEGEPCLNCLYKDKKMKREGILNQTVNIIASVQASETMKLITGRGNLNKKLLLVDLKENSFRKLKVKKNKDCSSC